MARRVTLSISTETYGKLRAIRTRMEKITGKSISLDQALALLLVARPLDVVLMEMVLEG